MGITEEIALDPTFLGITYDPMLTWKTQTEKADTRAKSCEKTCKTSWGADAKTLKTVYTDKIEVLKLLKVVKTARFKAFKSELEAVDFSTTVQSPRPLPGQVTTPVPSEGCKYKEPKPQDLVKLRKAVETSDLDYIRECAAANPR